MVDLGDVLDRVEEYLVLWGDLPVGSLRKLLSQATGYPICFFKNWNRGQLLAGLICGPKGMEGGAVSWDDLEREGR